MLRKAAALFVFCICTLPLIGSTASVASTEVEMFDRGPTFVQWMFRSMSSRVSQVYESLERIIGRAFGSQTETAQTGSAVVALNTSDPPYDPFSPPETSKLIGTSTSRVDPAGAPQQVTVVNNNYTQPVIERTIREPVLISGVTESTLASRIAEAVSVLNARITTAFIGAAQSARVENLSDVTLTRVTGLTDNDIPNTITAENYLPLTGGTVSGDLNVSGTLTAGTLSVAALASSGALAAPYFTATSTSASSTFPNLNADNATITNATTTSFFSSLARVTDLVVDGVLSAASVSYSNLLATSISATNATTSRMDAYDYIAVGRTSTTTIFGSATSTFGAGIRTSALDVTSTSASSTFANGINLTDGCFAIDGSCLSLGSGSSFAYLFPNSATTTLLNFSGGLTAYASSTIGTGTATGGLTVSGSATTTRNQYIAGHMALGNSSALDSVSLLYPGDTGSVGLSLQETRTAFTADFNTGLQSHLLLNPSSEVASNVYGVHNEVEIQSGNAQDFSGELYGSYASVTHRGSGTASFISANDSTIINAGSGIVDYGVADYSAFFMTGTGTTTLGYGSWSNYTHSSSGTSSEAFGSFSRVNNMGVGRITTGYGSYIDSAMNSGGGTFLNNYGLYIADQSAVGSQNSFNLYSAGSNAKNYFAGSISIGTTTPYSKLTTWGSGQLFEAVNTSSTTVFRIGQNGATSTNLFGSNILGNTARFGATGTTTIDSAGNLTVLGNSSLARATSTNLAVTSLTNCDTIDSDANGNFVCGTDTGGGGSSFGQGWEISNGALVPTTSIGILVNSSSTFTGGLIATAATSTTLFSSLARFSTGIIDSFSSPVADITSLTASTLIATNATTTRTDAYDFIAIGRTSTTTIFGSATSTFGAGIRTTALDVTSTTATSTFANGIRLSGGCFMSASGSCITTGLSSVTKSDIANSGTLSFDWTDAEVDDALTITGGTINNTAIGAVTPQTAIFTNASSTNFFGTNVLGNAAQFGATATTSVSSAGDLTVGGGDIVLGATSIFSGGDTASLNNIDAIDATTEATFEAAIDALSNLTTTGALNSGSITSGFGSIDVGSDSITAGSLLASSNDVGALGASGTAWSDLFLASGGVVNWLAGDVTVTHAANSLTFDGASAGYVFSSGNVGIGTSSPFRKLSITDAVSTAQQVIAYDATRYTDLLTNSVGDFIINPQGDDAFLNDDNLWVCSGGSCPGAVSGTGNLMVENSIHVSTGNIAGGGIEFADDADIVDLNDAYVTIRPTSGVRITSANGAGSTVIQLSNGSGAPTYFNSSNNVGIGTTSPVQQFSIADRLYVGAGGATGMGTATSTFQGDIKIIGKLDVSTIDPPYTIDGTKYATYGHSTIGVKEEMTTKLELSLYDEERDLYFAKIDWRSAEIGSDVWLFKAVSNFGRTWDRLVVSLTPAFEGTVFYEEDVEEDTLFIYGTRSGFVSVRLIADRYDAATWPNLRPDQDGDTQGTHVIDTSDDQ